MSHVSIRNARPERSSEAPTRPSIPSNSEAWNFTPFGGLVSLIALFERIGRAGQIGGLMPFGHTSPNAIPPAQTLVAFIVSVVAEARRLAHTDWLRADKALHALLGIERFTLEANS